MTGVDGDQATGGVDVVAMLEAWTLVAADLFTFVALTASVVQYQVTLR